MADSPWCTQGQALKYVPAAGQALIGEVLDWSAAGIGTPPGNPAADAATRLGAVPAVYSINVPYVDDQDSGVDPQHPYGFLDTVADEVSHEGGMLAVTLDLPDGVDPRYEDAASVAYLTDALRTYNTVMGVPVLLRIGPEMNGSWDPWGQQPIEFRAFFRTLAAAVHANDPGTQTVWSPNYAGGNPWSTGQYVAQPGTADFAAIDTNHDGKLTEADDPYAPYYPGDDVVDWVGISVYHFGTTYPWGPNVLPEDGKFESQLLGTFADTKVGRDETYAPNFYGTYATGHGKPMMISETGAWVDTNKAVVDSPKSTATGQQIKTNWWNQIEAVLQSGNYPLLKAVTFFNTAKTEPTASATTTTDTIDWTIDSSQDLVNAFDATFTPASGAIYASGDQCFAGGLPYPPTTAAASVTAAAPTTAATTTAVAAGGRSADAVTTPQHYADVRRCTTTRTPGTLSGHRVTRVTTSCVTRRVQVIWTTAIRCSGTHAAVSAAASPHHKDVVAPSRGCRQVPVAVQKPVKVLNHSTKVTILRT